jgi:hypothetical protein
MDVDWNNEAATRAAIREEAERVLRARVKPTLPSCAGPCDQGRRLCPCPDACMRIEDDGDGLDAARGILLAVALVASIVATVGALHWALA